MNAKIRFRIEKWLLRPETPEEEKEVNEYIEEAEKIAQDWKKTLLHPFSSYVREVELLYLSSVVGLHHRALLDLIEDLRDLYCEIRRLQEELEALKKELGEEVEEHDGA